MSYKEIVEEATKMGGEFTDLILLRQVRTASDKFIDEETIAAVLDISVSEVRLFLAHGEKMVFGSI